MFRPTFRFFRPTLIKLSQTSTSAGTNRSTFCSHAEAKPSDQQLMQEREIHNRIIEIRKRRESWENLNDNLRRSSDFSSLMDSESIEGYRQVISDYNKEERELQKKLEELKNETANYATSRDSARP